MASANRAAAGDAPDNIPGNTGGYMAEQDGWSWSEQDSDTYRALAEVAVPRREEQLAALLCLLPFARDEAFRAVELGCGEGELARALLAAFPNARLLALDGSASMRERAVERLAPFGERAQVAPFDLESSDWFGLMDGAGCVVSSLVVHHLDADGKRRLFGAAQRRMGDRAALLLADIALPQRPEAWRLFADAYDAASRERSIARTGRVDLYERLVAEHWNHYRYPDAAETPSPLASQLAWLADAGFEGADCFWAYAGHAVYGGYKGAGAAQDGGLGLADALAAVGG